MPISTITNEPNEVSSNELTGKVRFAQRFKPTNLKRNAPSTKSKPVSIVRPLQADDIKEHRWWALGSTILCFFLIAPCIALYHTHRIRTMKENGELTQAKTWSDRVNNLLIVSNIIGIVIWVAVLFVVGVLLIFGAVY